MEARLERSLKDKSLDAQLLEFSITSDPVGNTTTVPQQGEVTPGLVWTHITDDDLRKLDTFLVGQQRHQHRCVVLPYFPLAVNMYTVDAWVYTLPQQQGNTLLSLEECVTID